MINIYQSANYWYPPSQTDLLKSQVLLLFSSKFKLTPIHISVLSCDRKMKFGSGITIFYISLFFAIANNEKYVFWAHLASRLFAVIRLPSPRYLWTFFNILRRWGGWEAGGAGINLKITISEMDGRRDVLAEIVSIVPEFLFPQQGQQSSSWGPSFSPHLGLFTIRDVLLLVALVSKGVCDELEKFLKMLLTTQNTLSFLKTISSEITKTSCMTPDSDTSEREDVEMIVLLVGTTPCHHSNWECGLWSES